MMNKIKKYALIALGSWFLVILPWKRGIESYLFETEFKPIDVNPYVLGFMVFLCAALIVLIYQGTRELYLDDQEPSYKPGDTLENVNKTLENEQIFLADKETNTFAWGNPSPTPK